VDGIGVKLEVKKSCSSVQSATCLGPVSTFSSSSAVHLFAWHVLSHSVTSDRSRLAVDCNEQATGAGGG
jgi:hypothetical protein